MKKLIFLFLFVLASGVISAQKNFTFLGKKTYPTDLSDIWGYAANNKEYALVGVYNGVSIVDVTVPTNPVELHFIPGPNTYWRDIKTWSHFAYVTNESSGGLLIIDLDSLPGIIKTYTWTGGALGLAKAHNIFIDEKGIAYVMGGNVSAGHGAIFLDLNSTPTNPQLLGKYNTRYVHDGFVRGDTLWTAEINDGIFSVVNISNKSAPVILATHATPSNFTHNLWLTADAKTLLTTDERSNAVIAAYDVSNLNNINEKDQFQSNPGSGVIPHNVFYVNDDFAVIAYYRDGVVLLDASNPDNLIEVGNYDSSPLSGNGFNGSWGIYPWLPSGNVIATDIEQGLFVLGPAYIKACYLEGTVTDIVTGNPLNTVSIQILPNPTLSSTGLTGQYKTGIADSGTYSVQFSKSGYVTHVENNVVLKNGLTTILNTQMIPSIAITLSGQVLDSSTGIGIPSAKVLIKNSLNTYSATTNSSGIFSIPSFQTGRYDAYAGKWGHLTNVKNVTIFNAGNSLTFRLDSGYYDDYLFDFNWTVTSTASAGIWVRAEPNGTLYNGEESNPENDVPNDFGDSCYITGNGGGGAGDDDVDNGSTILTSPVFDLSAYNDPHIKYHRWFFNDGGTGTPNDQLLVKLTNGQTTVTVETVTASSSNWIPGDIRVIDFLTPASNMRIIFDVGDLGTQHLLEAGIDLFRITDTNTIFPPVANFTSDVLEACPGSSIQFTDLSTRLPHTWSWQFPGGTPAVSTAQNPTVIFNNPGVYNITLTATNDGGSGFAVKNSFIIIHENPALNITPKDITCPDGNDGTAVVSVTNPQGVYTYHWTNGSQADNISGLVAGNYSVTVTNDNSCSASITTLVQQPSAISFTEIISDALCGVDNGEIQLTVSGGTAPYLYNWNTGDTTSVIESLSAGTYEVTITDNNQCRDSADFSISNFDGPSVAFSVISVTCFGGNDGSIQLTVTGGTVPISYSWASGFSIQNLSALSSGNYKVTVSDSNNCLSIKNITVLQPPALLLNLIGNDATCGNDNGKVFAVASGGTLPYSILWDIASSADSLTGLSPGAYISIITDSHNCSTTDTAVIINIEGPSVAAGIVNVSCYGGNNGEINLTVSDGTPPYSYVWEEDLFSGVRAGEYSVTITDANSCFVTESYIIQQPDSFSFEIIVTEASSPGMQDGSARIITSGGTTPYRYEWSNGSEDDHADDLGQGNHFVTIIDSNGCNKTVEFLVGASTINSVGNLKNETILIYPNPFSDEILIEIPFSKNKVKISVYNLQGKMVDAFELSVGKKVFWGNGFDNGIYFAQFDSGSNQQFFKIIKTK